MTMKEGMISIKVEIAIEKIHELELDILRINTATETIKTKTENNINNKIKTIQIKEIIRKTIETMEERTIKGLKKINI